MNKVIYSPIIFLLAVSFAVFLVLPNVSSLSDVAKQVAAKQQELKEKQAYYAGMRATLKELETYKSSTEAISEALPEGLSLAAMLDYFQREALSSGLVLKNVGQDIALATETTSKFKEAFFSITVQGSIESIETFLSKLEMSSRIIEVETLGMKAQSSMEAALPEANLKVKIYYY